MKRFLQFTAISALLLLLAAGLAWRVQSKLQAAAEEHLSKAGPAFQHVVVRFDGQRAQLSGSVRYERDLLAATALIRESVRVAPLVPWKDDLNPVVAVDSAITAQPLPVGWCLLSATPAHVRVLGEAASANEAQRLNEAVRSTGLLGEGLENEVAVDDERLMEASPLDPTLASTPRITDSARRMGTLAIAKLGESWQVLDLAQPAVVLRRQLIERGMTASAWEEGVASEVVRLHRAYEQEQEARAEQQRLASLPAGHVVLAIRGAEVLLKGELGSEAMIVQLLEAAAKAYPKRRVLDDLVLSAQRKPEATPDILSKALPSIPIDSAGKLLAIGVPVKGWRVIEAASVSAETIGTLPSTAWPEASDPRLSRPDLAAAAAWLEGDEHKGHGKPATTYPAHLLLAAYGNRVILRGAVGDEATRSQLEAAARRVYPGRELSIQIRLDVSRTNPEGALQTALSLPPAPSPEGSAILGFAIVGEEWHTRAARLWLLEPAGFASGGLVPKSFPINLTLPDLAEVVPHLKAHHQATLQTQRQLPAMLLLPPKAKP